MDEAMKQGTVQVKRMWKNGLARAALGLVLGTAVSSAAGAADGDDMGARLRACRVIPDLTTRAFCYDRIVDTLGTAPLAPPLAPPLAQPRAAAPVSPATPAAPVPPRAGAQPTAPAAPAVPAAPVKPEDRFGEKDLAAKQRVGENEQPPDELVLKVMAARTDKGGYTTFTLENGQVWRQVESSSLRVSNGARVKIKSGTLGAFYLSLDGGNKSFRVKRVQ